MQSHRNNGDMNVLLIENDAHQRLAFRMVIDGWGCRTVASRSVEAAERAIAVTGFRPDVVVTALLFDREHAESAVERIAAMLERVGFAGPVIVATGCTDPRQRQLVEARGWTMLIKPFPPSHLRVCLGDRADHALDRACGAEIPIATTVACANRRGAFAPRRRFGKGRAPDHATDAGRPHAPGAAAWRQG